MNRLVREAGLRPELVSLAIPLTLASATFHPKAPLGGSLLLLAISLLRQPEGAFKRAAGPFLLMAFASAIVFSRPYNFWDPALTVVFLALLLLRLLATVDARRMIASTIDGTGLLMAANLLLQAAGMRNKAATYSEPFGRITYPLTEGLNNPSVVAAAVVMGSLFLLHEPGWLRRSFRLGSIASAILLMIGAGTRTSIGVVALLTAAALLVPYASRGLVQVVTVIAATSAFVIPELTQSLEFIIKPLSNLNPGRETEKQGAVSFNGRVEIWDAAIKYWNNKITYIGDRGLGFGEVGQYRSGVSQSYQNIVAATSATPQYATVHNTFLEQLFDGGVVGFILFPIAIFWAGVRLSRRCQLWGNYSLSAIYAIAALLLGGITEAIMAPGAHGEAYWMLLWLVAATGQAAGPTPIPPSGSPPSESVDSGVHAAPIIARSR